MRAFLRGILAITVGVVIIKSAVESGIECGKVGTSELVTRRSSTPEYAWHGALSWASWDDWIHERGSVNAGAEGGESSQVLASCNLPLRLTLHRGGLAAFTTL